MNLRAPAVGTTLTGLVFTLIATAAHAAPPEVGFGVSTHGLSFGAQGSWWIPASRSLGFGVRSEALGVLASQSSLAGRGEALTCFGWSSRTTTLWAGFGAWRPSQTMARAASPMAAFGAEAQRGAVRWSAQASRAQAVMTATPYRDLSVPDTLPPSYITPEPKDVTVTTLAAEFTWSRPRWDVVGGLGVSVGPDFSPMERAHATLTNWVGSSLGVRAAARGAAPRWISGETSENARYELGIVFQPGARVAAPAVAGDVAAAVPVVEDERSDDAPLPRWRIAARRDGAFELFVYVNDARSVSVRGDFSDWEWIALDDAGAGWWSAVRVIAPGLHSVEVAIDGTTAERVEGLTRGAGDYGSAVGVFVIE